MLIPFEMSERMAAWARAHGFDDPRLLIETALRRFVRKWGERRGGCRKRAEVPPVALAAVSAALARLELDTHDASLPTAAPMQARPDDDRLWGQVNRLAPLKVIVRGLAAAAVQRPGWPRFAAVAGALASDAAVLGSVLAVLDARAGRRRDTQLATGLPRHDNAASQTRFLDQYVARAPQRGGLRPGAVCQFGLAAVVGEQLALTEAGVRLARLRSPLLDSPLEAATHSLSDAERVLLLEQIVRVMPAELRDTDVVLRAVAAGARTPEALLAAARGAFPPCWSDLAYRTHIGGLVACLVDLGLLVRRWRGRHVAYALGAPACASPVLTPDEPLCLALAKD